MKIRSAILAVAAVTAFAVPALADSVACTVQAPEIRLRKSPSKKGRIIAILKKDERVTTAKACAGGWVKVVSRDGKLTGYLGGWALTAAAPAVAESSPPPALPEANEAEPAHHASAHREVPTNEKLAMQITELRLNVLSIERDMQQMNKEIKKIKVTLKRKAAARKVASN